MPDTLAEIASRSLSSCSLESEVFRTRGRNSSISAITLSGVALAIRRNSAEVPGWIVRSDQRAVTAGGSQSPVRIEACGE